MESFDSLGEFMDLDLLDHLGDGILLNDQLLFLGTVCTVEPPEMRPGHVPNLL